MPRKADNFAIFNDVIGTSRQCLGKRGRIYQIINVGRKRKYVIMWNDLSRSELTVRCFKKAGVSDDRRPDLNRMEEEISDNNSTDQSSINDEQSNAEEEEKQHMEQEELRPEPIREELG